VGSNPTPSAKLMFTAGSDFSRWDATYHVESIKHPRISTVTDDELTRGLIQVGSEGIRVGKQRLLRIDVGSRDLLNVVVTRLS
jgi:hypothetical protein